MKHVMFVHPDDRGRVALGKVINKDGYYRVTFDSETGAITLEPMTLPPDVSAKPHRRPDRA